MWLWREEGSILERAAALYSSRRRGHGPKGMQFPATATQTRAPERKTKRTFALGRCGTRETRFPPVGSELWKIGTQVSQPGTVPEV